MNKKLTVALIAGLAVFLSFLGFASKKNQKIETESGSILESQTSQMNKTNPPEMEIDKNKTYQAVLETDKGEIIIDLFAQKTPITVNNFVYLARKGFYDETFFHRVIKGFMIQGGDPNGDGTGGPGYKFDDEPFEGEYQRGVVAMANAGPNTNGSQFFIMHQNYPLPKDYVIFGKVTKGMEVVDKIANSAVETGPSGENSTPVEPTIIKKATIVED